MDPGSIAPPPDHGRAVLHGQLSAVEPPSPDLPNLTTYLTLPSKSRNRHLARNRPGATSRTEMLPHVPTGNGGLPVVMACQQSTSPLRVRDRVAGRRLSMWLVVE